MSADNIVQRACRTIQEGHVCVSMCVCVCNIRVCFVTAIDMRICAFKEAGMRGEGKRADVCFLLPLTHVRVHTHTYHMHT